MKKESTDKLKKILELLEKNYPNARCTLDYKNPVELLIATILSAQCTDERVNKITKTLFKKYKSAKDYAYCSLDELEKDIKPTGFYRNKAKNIKGACQIIVEKFAGKIPTTMDEMMLLPGVARKTANVVLGNGYGIIEGVVVDTHVSRVSQRLGLTKNEDPTRIEFDLMNLIPKEKWLKFSHQIILHGRNVCKSKDPRCNECFLNSLCPSVKDFSKCL